MKRQDPCFWINNECPFCGRTQIVYTPDLLNGPVENICVKCNNRCRFAAEQEQKDKIAKLLTIAERQDEVNKEYLENRIKLGYK